jgi:FAD/FMN-containing dehydrogenase
VSDVQLVNDVHSQLNATCVHRVTRPTTLDELCAAIRAARSEGRSVSVAGGRHAMGGQQFGTDTVLVDMTAMTRVLDFDAELGLVEAEAGIEWPALIGQLVEAQRGRDRQWGIVQKQTGADRLSLGGALAANVHGRGLRLKPIVGDIESFVLVGADGEPVRCSREENPELFRLAIGGYGLFGVMASVTLRLAPRQKVQRVVELLEVKDLVAAVERRVAEGYLYGDLQFATDEHGDDFLRRGIFSCYRPVDPGTPMPAVERQLTAEDWTNLIYLSHADRRGGVDAYTAFYLASSGQVYWSDTHQLSEYVDDYHRWLDRQLGTPKATEIITEIYVPRPTLPNFLYDVRDDFRQNGVELIYGTIRFIERDDETFLAWAREPYACVIFNLHTVHSPDGIERSATAFRRLIDLAIHYGGSYYLTYHRFATRAQVEACYPQLTDFLRLKRRYDPEERFQSDWYRHYRGMFADAL